jgi:hypothetical protein
MLKRVGERCGKVCVVGDVFDLSARWKELYRMKSELSKRMPTVRFNAT